MAETNHTSPVPEWLLSRSETELWKDAYPAIERTALGEGSISPVRKFQDDLEAIATGLRASPTTIKARIRLVSELERRDGEFQGVEEDEWARWAWIARFGLRWEGKRVRVTSEISDLQKLHERAYSPNVREVRKPKGVTKEKGSLEPPRLSLEERLRFAEISIEGKRKEIREEVQRTVQSLGSVEANSLKAGRDMARRINAFVSSKGFRFRYPSSELPANLNFHPSGDRGDFYLVCGGQPYFRLKDGLGTVEIIDAPLRKSRGKS